MATGFTVMDMFNKGSGQNANEPKKARFRTKDISIFKIYSNSANFYPQEGIEEKAQEIFTTGLLENLVVKFEPCELGEYKLISGERRWRGLKMLAEQGYKEYEITTCQIRVYENEYEEMLELIIANSSRDKTDATLIKEAQELHNTLAKMREKNIKLNGRDLSKGALRDAVAQMLNKSRTKVGQIESIINNLIPEFKEELDKGAISFTAAYKLSGMEPEKQREWYNKYVHTGDLKSTDLMDGNKQLEQPKPEETGPTGPPPMPEADTQPEPKPDNPAPEQPQPDQTAQAGDNYEPAHPESVTSICYSCGNYTDCNVKTGTCTSCDQYINKAEAEKTDEQRYAEEQEAIDRETNRKLREQADEERTNQLPSSTEKGPKIHNIKLGTEFFEEKIDGRKPFELLKNDREYKAGDILEEWEYKDGEKTGRKVQELVLSVLQDYTGLEDGYCILGTKLL